MQKRKEHSAQGIPKAKDELIKSKGTTDIHQAAAVTTDEIDDGKNYPYFDSGCTTVLTNSMRNCREVEEHVVQNGARPSRFVNLNQDYLGPKSKDTSRAP